MSHTFASTYKLASEIKFMYLEDEDGERLPSQNHEKAETGTDSPYTNLSLLLTWLVRL